MASILLIDDDDTLREILATVLTDSGHTVAQASDGGEGLKIFRSMHVDLVITDIVMPGQEGLETLMTMRNARPVPIIAMSGDVTFSKLYLRMARKLGAQRVLAKPFTPAELLDAVAEALGENPELPLLP